MITGDRIKQARELRCLPQMRLAEKIGVKQPTIAKIENGNLKPSDEVLEAISLQTAFQYLFLSKKWGQSSHWAPPVSS